MSTNEMIAAFLTKLSIAVAREVGVKDKKFILALAENYQGSFTEFVEDMIADAEERRELLKEAKR